MSANALILDFGGVISKTLFETHRQTERALGLKNGTLTWLGPFDSANDPLWRAMLNDEMTERDYWHARAMETAALVGKDWQTMQDFVVAARAGEAMEVIRPEFLQAFQRAKAAGRKLGILSNELDLFYGKDFREQLPFMADFDAVIDASYTQILKPDARAYELILDALAIEPADAVFVDDQARNVKGAQALGLQTVHFDVTQPADSYDDALAKLGV